MVVVSLAFVSGCTVLRRLGWSQQGGFVPSQPLLESLLLFPSPFVFCSLLLLLLLNLVLLLLFDLCLFPSTPFRRIASECLLGLYL